MKAKVLPIKSRYYHLKGAFPYIREDEIVRIKRLNTHNSFVWVESESGTRWSGLKELLTPIDPVRIKCAEVAMRLEGCKKLLSEYLKIQHINFQEE